MSRRVAVITEQQRVGTRLPLFRGKFYLIGWGAHQSVMTRTLIMFDNSIEYEYKYRTVQ
jgi:hypothetical protein